MRLLIINPNTSAAVTAHIRKAADDAALASDRFTTVSAAFGPKLIVTGADATRATLGVLETVRAHADPVDGIVLASFGDTGAQEVRALRPTTPVIGIASAAFSVVRAFDGLVGIVTFAESLVPGLRAKAEDCGLGPKLLAVASATSGEIADPGAVQTLFFDEIAALCEQMQRRGAAVIVLGGGPLAGMTDALTSRCSVPVVDGTRAAISLMRALGVSRAGDRQRSLVETRL